MRLRELAHGLDVRRLRLGVARSLSATLQAKSIGFIVSRKNRRATALSSSESGAVKARRPASRCAASFSATASASLRLLVAAPGVLLELFLLPRDRLEVGEDELGLDRLDVAHRIERAGDVDDVLVLEAAHDLDDRVHLADVLEELVAEALALATRP